jgi:GNAT superfamily N-acetyltransferase
MTRMQNRMAQRTVSSRLGTALFNDDLARVYYLNFLRVEAESKLVPGDLVEETDVLQSHLRHRKFEVNDERGASLEQSFHELGWKVERDVVMIHRGPGRDVSVGGVIEATSEDLRPTWEDGIRESPHGTDEDVVRQLVEAQLLRERAVDVRYFTVRADDRLVTECSLFSDGQTAQVESVQTLEAYRGRGYASATVAKAVQEAEATGHELVFLLANEEDWPKDLYAKLGFETVGRVWEFVREPEQTRTGPT